MTSYSNTHLVELALRLIRTTDVDAVLAGAVETLAETCQDARWAIFHRLEDGPGDHRGPQEDGARGPRSLRLGHQSFGYSIPLSIEGGPHRL